MSDLTKGSGGPPSRRGREKRAYRLVVTGGTAGAVAVVSFVLAVFGVVGFGIPLIAIVVAVICGVLLRRAVGR
jgi:putative flippase GtrA